MVSLSGVPLVCKQFLDPYLGQPCLRQTKSKSHSPYRRTASASRCTLPSFTFYVQNVGRSDTKCAGANDFMPWSNIMHLHAPVQGIINDTAAFISISAPDAAFQGQLLLLFASCLSFLLPPSGCARSPAIVSATHSFKALCLHFPGTCSRAFVPVYCARPPEAQGCQVDPMFVAQIRLSCLLALTLITLYPIAATCSASSFNDSMTWSDEATCTNKVFGDRSCHMTMRDDMLNNF